LESAAGGKLTDIDLEHLGEQTCRDGEDKAAAGPVEVVDIDAAGRVGDGEVGGPVDPGSLAGAVGETDDVGAAADRAEVADHRSAGDLAIDVGGGVEAPMNPVGASFDGEVDAGGRRRDAAGEDGGIEPASGEDDQRK